jgi:hypothetical protein
VVHQPKATLDENALRRGRGRHQRSEGSRHLQRSSYPRPKLRRNPAIQTIYFSLYGKIRPKNPAERQGVEENDDKEEKFTHLLETQPISGKY